ncbi:MAG: Fic family protein [Chitinophagaceae bacterium]|jgi:Fic family protein|nr:Fic family protein [Chitinophagaceae bacterium]
MNIEDFKSGNFTMQYGYRSFHPNPINRQWNINNPAINTLLEEANLKLGELNAFSAFVPDVDVFIRMHIVKEATQSSRIEGTRTRMDEAVMNAKDIHPEQKDDWQEVQNYIEAMNQSIKSLKKLPLSSRLIRQAHKTLLKGVRGKNKLPGEFRSSQNWIGGATINDAVFVPPHHTLVAECIGDMEKFLNNEKIQVPHLIRIGMAHYQFEAIHPFLDGNGRIGRLLITLYLIDKGLLSKPTLYLSDFIEKNRQHYYNNLRNVSFENQMEQWLKFFLVGVIETAKNAINTFTGIIALRENLEKDVITGLGKKLPAAKLFLNYLYSKPVVTVPDVIETLHITKPTAHALIKDFQNLEILKEQTGYKRNRIFVFERYLKLFEK